MAWQTKKLGEVCNIGAGNSAPQNEKYFKNGKYPFFRTSDIGMIHLGEIINAVDYLNDAGVKGLKLYKKGTILLPKSGASTFLNHRVIMGADGYVSSHLATINTDEKILNNKFLFYFLQEVKAQDLIQDQKYPSLNLPIIGNIAIPLPPLPEQRRIVKILDEVFENIKKAKENTETNLQNSKDLFESYLQNVFANSGEAWKEKKIYEICSFFTDGNWIESKDQSTSGIRLIQTGNIGQGFFKDRSSKARYISEATFKRLKCTEIFAGDILISRLPDPVGRACIIPENNEKMITAVDCSILRLKIDVLPEYLNYYMQSREYFRDVDSRTTGTTRNRISRRNLGLIEVPVPPLAVQKSNIAKLDALSAQTKKLEEIYKQKLADLEELKKSVLKKAFSGGL